MQTEGNMFNVHQAASNSDPKEVGTESTCTLCTHSNIFLMRYISLLKKNTNKNKS